jgi:hypothetical protein
MVNAGPHDGLPAFWGFFCRYISTEGFANSVVEYTLGDLFPRQLAPVLDASLGSAGGPLTFKHVVSPYPLGSHYDAPQKWMLLRQRGGRFEPFLVAIHQNSEGTGWIFSNRPGAGASRPDPPWFKLACIALVVVRGGALGVVLAPGEEPGMFRLQRGGAPSSDDSESADMDSVYESLLDEGHEDSSPDEGADVTGEGA